MRRHDWMISPLGDPTAWPEVLRGSVSLMLSSGFPTSIMWGQEGSLLYNDAYREILGIKHPSALGTPIRKVWWEALDILNPLLDRAMAGEAIFLEDIPAKLQRKGFAEEAFFTFYYSPLHLENGTIGGINCGCIETTEKVLKARQVNDLLSDRNDFWNFARDMIAVIDYNGILMDVSPAAYKILGWLREENDRQELYRVCPSGRFIQIE